MRYSDFSELFKDKSKMPGQQAQKFNRLIIEGLAANGACVHVISGTPVTAQNYSSKFFPGKKCFDSKVCYDYLPAVTIPVVKNLLQLLLAFFKVLFSRNVDAVLCDVLNASVSYGASLAAKLRRLRFVGIVTDVPWIMYEQAKPGYLNTVRKILENCSHYIFLTQQMDQLLNPKGKPYLVIEAICDKSLENSRRCPKQEKLCMYAGTLAIKYGIKNLVEAFLLANVPGAELHIYGSGEYAGELSSLAGEHGNIVYHGNVLNRQVVQAELEANLLINPRPSGEEFTKYSFPSKNMEYMATGTPVLTTDLPGIPAEYKDRCFLIEDESIEGLAGTLKKLLSMDSSVLDDMGNVAREFVLREKNQVRQTEKILAMLK